MYNAPKFHLLAWRQLVGPHGIFYDFWFKTNLDVSALTQIMS